MTQSIPPLVALLEHAALGGYEELHSETTKTLENEAYTCLEARDTAWRCEIQVRDAVWTTELQAVVKTRADELNFAQAECHELRVRLRGVEAECARQRHFEGNCLDTLKLSSESREATEVKLHEALEERNQEEMEAASARAELRTMSEQFRLSELSARRSKEELAEVTRRQSLQAPAKLTLDKKISSLKARVEFPSRPSSIQPEASMHTSMTVGPWRMTSAAQMEIKDTKLGLECVGCGDLNLQSCSAAEGSNIASSVNVTQNDSASVSVLDPLEVHSQHNSRMKQFLTKRHREIPDVFDMVRDMESSCG